MPKRISLPGAYAALESPLHRLDARFKLVLTLAFIVACFCAQGFAGLAVVLAFALALYRIARIPLGLACRTAGPLLIIAIITAVLNLLFVQGGDVYFSWWVLQISAQGCRNAVFFGGRIALLVFIACLLVLTTTTVDITNASERLLGPLKRLRVPVHELAMIAGISLRFFPEFAREFETIRQAQASRCARLNQGGFRRRAQNVANLASPLFRSAFHRSETLANAMDSRCYHGDAGRTSLHPFHASGAEALACALTVLAFAAIFAANSLGI